MTVNRAASQLQHASDTDYTTYLIAFSIACLALSSVAIAARCSARYRTGRPTGDDVFALVAYVALVLTIVAALIIATKGGVGLEPVSRGEAAWIANAHLSVTFTFAATLVAGKTSLLLLYRRIFGMRERWFRWIWWPTLIVSLPVLFSADIATTAVMATANDSTTPIISYCIFAETFVCAVSNLVILILPVGMVMQLQMNRKKRVGLIFIFSLGSIASGIEFLRSARIIQELHGNWDRRYMSFEDLMLSLAETTAVVICACLILIRPLFVKLRELTSRSLKSITGSTVFSTSSRSNRDSFQCKGPVDDDDDVWQHNMLRNDIASGEDPGMNEPNPAQAKNFEYV